MEARRQEANIFKVLPEKDCQPKILYLVRLSFKNKGEIKLFPHKQKLEGLSLADLLYKKCQREF